jgi:HTH-type transcriptional regulator / antitoxin HigA
MSIGLANPAEMIAQGAPHIIHNDAELEAYTDALFQRTALESPSSSEVEAIELLTLLVERYEQEHYSIPAADPASVVRFLIAQQNLTQRDLIPSIWFGECGFDVLGRATESHPRTGAEIEHSVQTSY